MCFLHFIDDLTNFTEGYHYCPESRADVITRHSRVVICTGLSSTWFSNREEVLPPRDVILRNQETLILSCVQSGCLF